MHVWQVYTAALLLGCVSAVDTPTKKVFVAEMVGKDLLSNAISVNASIWHLGGLVGPAISGISMALSGVGLAIGVNVLGSIVVMAALLCMQTRELLPPSVVQRTPGQFQEALNYVRKRPMIFWPMLMLGIVSTFGMNLPVLLVSFANEIFDSGAAGYGLYSSAAGIGALVGALASARWLGYRLSSVLTTACMLGLALALSGFAPVTALFVCGLSAVGFTRLFFAITAESMVQLSSSLTIRGRVMAIYTMVLLGGQAVGGR